MTRIQPIMIAMAALVSVGSIVGGYLMAGFRMVLLAPFCLALLWIIARRRSRSWGASILFAAVVFLAGFGITEGLSFILMLTGIVAGLASWDLMLFDADMQRERPGEPNASTNRYHLKWLALALGVGWLISVLATNLELRLPFMVVALLALFSVFGLTTAIRSFQGHRR